MTEDFYCEEVLSGKTEVEKVYETENVFAYYHTRPFYKVHIVTIPKIHIPSLLSLDDSHNDLLLEMIEVIKVVASKVKEEHGACRVITNLGKYQDSKHLHWHIVSGETIK